MKLWLISTVVFLAACSKPSPAIDGGSSSPAPSSAPPSPAAAVIGTACKDEYDCSSAARKATSDFTPSSCEWRCVAAKCALLSQGAGVGATGCYGDNHGNATSFYMGSSPVARGVICDMDVQHAHCDQTTRTCIALKGIGETCSSWIDCRREARCAGGICVPKAAVGASCKDAECVVGATCDQATKACVANKPLGTECSVHDDCASQWCTNSLCAPHPAMSSCPI